MSPTRRGFINRLFGSSLVALAAALSAPVYTFLRPVGRPGTGEQTIRSATGEPIDPAEVPDGADVMGTLAGEKVVVLRRGAAFTALTATCTHLGCLVRYERDSDDLRCPCHGGRYALDGSVIGGPPSRPLRVIPVSVREGSLRVVEE